MISLNRDLFHAGQTLQEKSDLLEAFLLLHFGTASGEPIADAIDMLGRYRVLMNPELGMNIEPPVPEMAVLHTNMLRFASHTTYSNTSQAVSSAYVFEHMMRFLSERGPRLFPDTSLHMNLPNQLVDGRWAQAGSLEIATYESDDLTLPNFDLTVVLDECEAKIEAEIRAQKAVGKLVCPYAVLISSGVYLDPRTFDANIKFKTRFGLIDA